jgi:hypothetical protein
VILRVPLANLPANYRMDGKPRLIQVLAFPHILIEENVNLLLSQRTLQQPANRSTNRTMAAIKLHGVFKQSVDCFGLLQHQLTNFTGVGFIQTAQLHQDSSEGHRRTHPNPHGKCNET